MSTLEWGADCLASGPSYHHDLGAWRHLNGSEGGHALWLPAEHLVTHGVVVGMTGSGKTGLVTVLIDEAAKVRVPTHKLWGRRDGNS